MASSGRRTIGSGRHPRGGAAGGERQSIVQAMRARGRGRGRSGRSAAFELAGGGGRGAGATTASLQQLFKQARASGSLNLTSRGLEEVPEEVFNLIGTYYILYVPMSYMNRLIFMLVFSFVAAAVIWGTDRVELYSSTYI